MEILKLPIYYESPEKYILRAQKKKIYYKTIGFEDDRSINNFISKEYPIWDHNLIIGFLSVNFGIDNSIQFDYYLKKGKKIRYNSRAHIGYCDYINGEYIRISNNTSSDQIWSKLKQSLERIKVSSDISRYFIDTSFIYSISPFINWDLYLKSLIDPKAE